VPIARRLVRTAVDMTVINMTSPRPVDLRLDGPDLVITWNDGKTSRYSPGVLRASCPCATCAESRTQTEFDSQATHFSGVTFREITPVGNYAYQISFSDGHNTGIYTLDYLHRLSDLGQQ